MCDECVRTDENDSGLTVKEVMLFVRAWIEEWRRPVPPKPN